MDISLIIPCYNYENLIVNKFEKLKKNFKKIKFISKKFFFDAEIMILFYSLKKSMKYIPVKYSVPKDSTIKIFDIKNFLYIYEMIRVILFYKSTNLKKYGRFF